MVLHFPASRYSRYGTVLTYLCLKDDPGAQEAFFGGGSKYFEQIRNHSRVGFSVMFCVRWVSNSVNCSFTSSMFAQFRHMALHCNLEFTFGAASNFVTLCFAVLMGKCYHPWWFTRAATALSTRTGAREGRWGPPMRLAAPAGTTCRNLTSGLNRQGFDFVVIPVPDGCTIPVRYRNR